MPITIIDDSPIVRKILTTCLQREGFLCISFSNGLDALSWLYTSQVVPSLFFIDVYLPGMSGYKICQYLKSRPRLENIPRVIISRQNGTIDHIKARLAGACYYLDKPIKTSDIVELARHYTQLKQESIILQRKNQSEVTRIREQMDLESEAMARALYAPAIVARHEIIRHYYRCVEAHNLELKELIGEEDAAILSIEMMDQAQRKIVDRSLAQPKK